MSQHHVVPPFNVNMLHAHSFLSWEFFFKLSVYFLAIFSLLLFQSFWTWIPGKNNLANMLCILPCPIMLILHQIIGSSGLISKAAVIFYTLVEGSVCFSMIFHFWLDISRAIWEFFQWKKVSCKCVAWFLQLISFKPDLIIWNGVLRIFVHFWPVSRFLVERYGTLWHSCLLLQAIINMISNVTITKSAWSMNNTI